LQANQSTYKIVFHTQSNRTTHFAAFVCATITTGPVCKILVSNKLLFWVKFAHQQPGLNLLADHAISLFISGHNRSSLGYQFNVSFHSSVVTRVLQDQRFGQHLSNRSIIQIHHGRWLRNILDAVKICKLIKVCSFYSGLWNLIMSDNNFPAAFQGRWFHICGCWCFTISVVCWCLLHWAILKSYPLLFDKCSIIFT